MTEENKHDIGEEEYQFPTGDEYLSSQEHSDTDNLQEEDDGSDDMHEPARPGLLERFPILANKRVVSVIVLVVVAIVGFQLLGGSGHKTKVIKSQPQVINTPRTFQAKPVVVKPSPQVVGQLGQLKQAESGNENAISQLRSQIQQLQSSVNNSNAASSQLNQSIQALRSEVGDLSASLQSLKPKKGHVKKVAKPKPIVYHVRAIVPGRAWIKSTQGETMTVRVGDKIKQYGTVESINADRGMILTSSGKIIGYGVNDY